MVDDPYLDTHGGTAAEEEFYFTVELSGEGDGIDGEVQAEAIDDTDDTAHGVKFTHGVAKFVLKNNEWIDIKNLPVGMGYTVTETEDEDYVTAVNGVVGTNVAKGTIS